MTTPTLTLRRLAATFALGALLTAPFGATAAPVYDDQAGQAIDQLTSAGGIDLVASTNITHDAATASLVLTDPSQPAVIVTQAFAPASASAWGGAHFATTGLSASAVTVEALAADSTPIATLAVSPSNLPGYDLATSLAAIDATAHPQLRLRLTLPAASGAIAPTLRTLRVSWTPRAILAVSALSSGPTCSGAEVAFDIPVAVSSVGATGLVIKLDAPTFEDAPFAAPGPLTFRSASHGGQVHAGPDITLQGLTISAGDVYWTFNDTVSAGTTFIPVVSFRVPAGTDHGTHYRTRAHASASNALPITSTDTVFSVTSNPDPRIAIEIDGTFRVDGKNRADAGAVLIPRLTVRNPSALCRQPYHQPVVVHDLTDFHNGTDSGIGQDPIAISHDGVFVPEGESEDFHGQIVFGPAVVWTPDPIAPGQLRSFSYTLILADPVPSGPLADDDALHSTASLLSGHHTETAHAPYEVVIGVPVYPNGAFAVGQGYGGDTQVRALRVDLANTIVSYGETFSWILGATNTGISELRDVQTFMKVPDGVELTATSATAGVTLRFHTGGDTAPPGDPSFDYDPATGVHGPGWSTTPPADLSTVTWVAATMDRLTSPYFPASGSPQARATLQVRALPPADGCIEQTLWATGVFDLRAYLPPGETTPIPAEQAGTFLTDLEPMTVRGVTPSFERLRVLADETVRVGAGPVTYNVEVPNRSFIFTSVDTALDAVLTLRIPKVSINGAETYLPYLGIDPDGGSVDLSDLGDGIVRVAWPSIPANATREVALSLDWPRGGLSGQAATLNAEITAEDDTCGSVSATAAATVTLDARPALVVRKSVDLDAIDVGGTLNYNIVTTNTGDGVSRKTVVFDALPTALSLVHVRPDHPGVSVYVAASLPPSYPTDYSNPTQFSAALLSSGHFQLADLQADGSWTTSLQSPRWLALSLDNPALSPPQFTTGAGISARVRAVVQDVPVGTRITNRALVAASSVLPALSSPARSTLTDAPAARILRHCPDVVAAGAEFTFTVDTWNSAASDASAFIVTETLPDGLTYVGSTFTWNEDADHHSGVIVTPDVAGQTLTWDLTAALGGDLASLEGGQLSITVAVDGAASTGTLLTLTGAASAANTILPDGLSVTASCTSRVRAADLWTRLAVDRPNPTPASNVTITVLLSNDDLLAADGVGVAVTLPPELTYVPGSALLSGAGGYHFAGGAEPTVSGSTLTWTPGVQALTGPSGVPGRLGGASGSLVLTVQANVAPSTQPDTTFTVQAVATTSTGQGDDLRPDQASVSLRTPLPDLFVQVGTPVTARPDDAITSVIAYGNLSPQASGPGTHLIIPMPTGPSGAQSSTYLYHGTSHGELVYFHDAPSPPDFDPSNPSANGWAAAPSGLAGPVTHLAVVTGPIAGNLSPRTLTLTTAFADPVSGDLAPAGTDHTLCASVAGSGADEHPDNNSACDSTALPGVNVAAGLTLTPSGAAPGIPAGGTTIATLTLANAGTVSAYGLYLTLDSPILTPTFDGPTHALIETANGAASTAVSPTGDAIMSPIPLTFDGQTFTLGLTDDPSSPFYYRNVGLRAGDRVELLVAMHAPEDAGTETIAPVTASAGLDYQLAWDPATDPAEAFLADNVVTSSVTIYRPDLLVRIDGQTLDGAAFTAPGERVRWTVEYDSIGGIGDADGRFTASIPNGATYVIGSLTGGWEGATPRYLGPSGWGYTPTGAPGTTDPNVQAVQLRGPIPSPVTGGYNAQGDALASGAFDGATFTNGRVRATSQQGDTFTIGPVGADDEVVTWQRIILEQLAGDDPLTVTVLDAATSQPIPGYEGLPVDSSGAVNLSGLSAQTYPALSFVVTFDGGEFRCDPTINETIEIDGGEPVAGSYIQWPTYGAADSVAPLFSGGSSGILRRTGEDTFTKVPLSFEASAAYADDEVVAGIVGQSARVFAANASDDDALLLTTGLQSPNVEAAFPRRWRRFDSGRLLLTYTASVWSGGFRQLPRVARLDPATGVGVNFQLSVPNQVPTHPVIGALTDSVVAGRSNSNATLFLWTLPESGAATRVDFGPPPGADSAVLDAVVNGEASLCLDYAFNEIKRAYVVQPNGLGGYDAPVALDGPFGDGAWTSCDTELGGPLFGGRYGASAADSHAVVWVKDADSPHASGHTFIPLPDAGFVSSWPVAANADGWIGGYGLDAEGHSTILVWRPNATGGYDLTTVSESVTSAERETLVWQGLALMTLAGDSAQGIALAADGSYVFHSEEIPDAIDSRIQFPFRTLLGFHGSVYDGERWTYAAFDFDGATGWSVVAAPAVMVTGTPRARISNGRFAAGAVQYQLGLGHQDRPALWRPGPAEYETVQLQGPAGQPPLSSGWAHAVSADGEIAAGQVFFDDAEPRLVSWMRQADGSYLPHDVTATLGHDRVSTMDPGQETSQLGSGWGGHPDFYGNLVKDGHPKSFVGVIEPGAPQGVRVLYPDSVPGYMEQGNVRGFIRGGALEAPTILADMIPSSDTHPLAFAFSYVGDALVGTPLPVPAGFGPCLVSFYGGEDTPTVVGQCESGDRVRWTRDSAGVWHVRHVVVDGFETWPYAVLGREIVGWASSSDFSQSGYATLQWRDDAWLPLYFAVHGHGVVSVNLDYNSDVPRQSGPDGYLLATFNPGGGNVTVIFTPPGPTDTHTWGTIVDGAPQGSWPSLRHYYGDGIFAIDSPRGIIRPDGSGGFVFDDLATLGVNGFNTPPQLAKHGQRLQSVSLDQSVHGSSHGILIIDEAGAHTIVPTFANPDLSSWTTNPVVFGGAEVFPFGQWDYRQLLGCSYASNASFGGVSVLYQSAGHPSFSFETETEVGCLEALSSTATAQASAPEVTADNNTDSASVDVEQADLAVTVAASQSLAVVDDELAWVVSVQNLGPSPATGVMLDIVPPAGTLDPFTALVGDLGVGATFTTTVNATAPDLADGTSLTLSATAVADQQDCVTTNDFASATTILSSAPNVWVQVVGPDAPRVGEPFPIEVRYGNDSAATLTEGTIAVALPPGLTLVSGDLSVAIGPVAPGSSDSFTVFALAESCDDVGADIEVIATLDSAEDALPGDDSDSVAFTLLDAAGQLSLAVLPDRATVHPGGLIRWTIHYRNDGSAPIADGVITATIPSGTTYVPGSLSRGTADGGLITIALESPLDDGAAGSISFLTEVTGATGTTLNGAASFDGDGACPVTTDYASAQITDGAVTITKVADRATVCGEGTITWSIAVSNQGTEPLNELVITDIVPAGTFYLGGSMTGGDTRSAANQPTLTWTLATLPPGEAFVVSFQTTAPTSDGALVSNVASLSAGGSPLGTSNSATVRVDCEGGLVLEKSAPLGCLAPGDTLTVDLAWHNPGPAATLTITDALPAGLAFASSPTGTHSAGVVSWVLPDVPTGASGVVSFTATVDPALGSGEIIANGAAITADDGRAATSNGTTSLVMVCGPAGACMMSLCDIGLGCVALPLDDGTLCDDGDLCTEGDACLGGNCVATPKTCEAADACHLPGTCDPGTGACSNPTAPDGTECDDGVGCTDGDQCTGGVCAGTDACGGLADLCDTDGFCNTESGTCEFGQAPCMAERYYALVEDMAGNVVGAIRCTVGAGASCDEDEGGLLEIYTDILACE